jgi:hypothetical protein
VSDYKEYSEVPVYEQAVWENGAVVNTKAVLIWGGKNGVLPPPVGEKITVTMNGLGNGDVVGYFSQDGYLGLRVQFDSPPEWYVKQNKGNPVGHIFGPEFKPL